MDGCLVSENLKRNRVSALSQSTLPKVKQRDKEMDTILTEWLKLTAPSQHHELRHDTLRRAHHLSCGLLAKTASPHSTREETPDKTGRAVHEMTLQYCLSVMVLKDGERLKKCHRGDLGDTTIKGNTGSWKKKMTLVGTWEKGNLNKVSV